MTEFAITVTHDPVAEEAWVTCSVGTCDFEKRESSEGWHDAFINAATMHATATGHDVIVVASRLRRAVVKRIEDEED